MSSRDIGCFRLYIRQEAEKPKSLQTMLPLIPALIAFQSELNARCNIDVRSGYAGRAIAETTAKLRPVIKNIIFFFIICSFLSFEEYV